MDSSHERDGTGFAPTTLATVVRAISHVLTERGLDAREVISRAGIDPDSLDRPGHRVPRPTMRRLWKLAVAETGLTRLRRYQTIVTAGVSFTLTETDPAPGMEIRNRGDETDLAEEAILAHQSSFNRAFRRWTGYAPGEVRRQGGG